MNYKIFSILIILTSFNCCGQNNSKKMETSKNNFSIIKTEQEWKQVLSPEQYNVLREKGTERPFTGKYWDVTDKGIYSCAACKVELFTSEQKFDAHCGWPSFDNEIGDGKKIKKINDYSRGMIRTEIVCANCGGHLGHLFDDGPTASGKRYCVNSLSIELNKK